MTRRIRPLPLAALTSVWVLLWGNVSWINVLSGLVVAAVIMWLFPLPPLMSRLRISAGPLVVLAARFFADLLVASVVVAGLALRPRPVSPGAVIDVPLTVPDDLRRTIVAELTSLVPGTVVIDLDQQSGVMTVHVVDTTDDAGLLREADKIHRLERRVARAFPVSGSDDDTRTPAPTEETAR